MPRWKGRQMMNKTIVMKILIPLVFFGFVGGLYVYKNGINLNIGQEEVKTEAKGNMPMLLDLGSDTCIPCQKMEPILAALEKKYAGTIIVRFIDVKQNPDSVDVYAIRVIPTQIFFDAQGRELFRHEGFIDQNAIEQKFAELGMN